MLGTERKKHELIAVFFVDMMEFLKEDCTKDKHLLLTFDPNEKWKKGSSIKKFIEGNNRTNMNQRGIYRILHMHLCIAISLRGAIIHFVWEQKKSIFFKRSHMCRGTTIDYSSSLEGSTGRNMLSGLSFMFNIKCISWPKTFNLVLLGVLFDLGEVIDL